MKDAIQNATFKWGNYFKATPANLQYFTEGIQGLLVAIASTNMVTGDPKVSFWLMIGTYLTGKLSKFFGRVEHDQQEIKIVVPGSVADQVEISQAPIDDTTNSK